MGDRTGLFLTARSLMRLQLIYGTIPLIRGKGDHAKQVAEFLDMLRGELGNDDGDDDGEMPGCSGECVRCAGVPGPGVECVGCGVWGVVSGLLTLLLRSVAPPND